MHYFNFEKTPELRSIFEQDYNPKRIIKELSTVQEQPIEKTELIFFDEIQECSQAITSLKYFNEDAADYAVIAAGSLLGVALSDTAFPVGKVDRLWLGPCTFEEYLGAAKLPLLVEAIQEYLDSNDHTTTINHAIHTTLWDEFRNFYVAGGLPSPIVTFLSESKENIARYYAVRIRQEELITDYQSDFSKYSEKENAIHIRQVFQLAAHQLAATRDETTKEFIFSHVIQGKKSYAQLQGSP